MIVWKMLELFCVVLNKVVQLPSNHLHNGVTLLDTDLIDRGLNVSFFQGHELAFVFRVIAAYFLVLIFNNR